jgi:hypothetical protein
MKLIYSHDYDQSYNPSAPVVEVTVGKPFVIPSLKLIALVDSGSDSLIIPLRYLKLVGAVKEKRVWMRNVGGSRFAVDLYSVSLSFSQFWSI